ncbi:hypothetical protein M9458_037786, partial [Cirrhinus mrigala]
MGPKPELMPEAIFDLEPKPITKSDQVCELAKIAVVKCVLVEYDSMEWITAHPSTTDKYLRNFKIFAPIISPLITYSPESPVSILALSSPMSPFLPLPPPLLGPFSPSAPPSMALPDYADPPWASRSLALSWGVDPQAPPWASDPSASSWLHTPPAPSGPRQAPSSLWLHFGQSPPWYSGPWATPLPSILLALLGSSFLLPSDFSLVLTLTDSTPYCRGPVSTCSSDGQASGFTLAPTSIGFHCGTSYWL